MCVSVRISMCVCERDGECVNVRKEREILKYTNKLQHEIFLPKVFGLLVLAYKAAHSAADFWPIWRPIFEGRLIKEIN